MPTFEEIAAYNREQYMKEVEAKRVAETEVTTPKTRKKAAKKPPAPKEPELNL